MNSPAAPTLSPAALVTPEAPWLGLRAFTEDLRGYFFGRDRELDDLFERAAQKPLTVLFGQSGLGKTSLLQAALIPRLRHAGFIPVLLRLDHSDSAPPLESQLLDALRAVLGAVVLPADDHAPSPLWRLLHDPVCGLCIAGAPRIVLMLDQFEEIFTLGETDAARRAASQTFLHALAEVVENRVPPALRSLLEHEDTLADRLDYAARPLKLLLSLREDFLHRLERWRPHMPSLMDNRFELRLLTGPQALEAVVEPGKLRTRATSPIPHSELRIPHSAPPPIVSPETGVEIVRFVAGVNGDVPLAEIDAVPPLLSLLCAELNAQRGASEVIRSEQLEGRAEDILAQFYERCFTPHPPAVRHFVEDRLLSPEGYRQAANEDTFLHEMAAAGIPGPDARRVLARLVDDRLLISEERGNIRRLELTHDTLTGVARRSRDLRRQVYEAARRRRQRMRWLGACAALMLILAAISLPLSVWALRERKRAVAARRAADEQINFMQYDLRDSLGDLGQLKLMERINTRIRLYHAMHPAEEGDSAAGHETAVAIEQQGDLLFSQGRLDQALSAFRRSLAIHERGARVEPERPSRRADLAKSYGKIGFVQFSQGHYFVALETFRHAERIYDGVAKQEPDNSNWQRALASTYTSVGETLAMLNDYKRGTTALRDALAITQSQAQQDPGNANRLQEVALAHLKLGSILPSPAAETSFHLALALATTERLAQQDPDNASWQRNLALSYEVIGDAFLGQGRFDDGLKRYRDSLAVRRRLVALDPTNADWMNDFAMTAQKIGALEQQQEHWVEAEEAFRGVLEMARAWLPHGDVEAISLLKFTYSAGHLWEILRDSPPEVVKIDRAKALEDLRTARDRLRRFHREKRMVSTMATDLSWIESLIAAAAKPELPDRLPRHFRYPYPFDDPGDRVWKREDDLWTEVSPTGVTKKFKTVSRRVHEGRKGTVVELLTEPGFEVFVSDLGVHEPAIFFRRNRGVWKRLGTIEDLE